MKKTIGAILAVGGLIIGIILGWIFDNQASSHDQGGNDVKVAMNLSDPGGGGVGGR